MKKLLIIIGVVVTLAAVLVLKTLADAGQFSAIRPHGDYDFQRLPGLPGPEDITIDQATGMAFISSDDRRAYLAGNPQQGAIYGLDLRVAGAPLVNLTADFSQAFHPHGISLYRTEAGELLIFAINHGSDSQYVEIFEYRDQRLQHRESISHPLMFSPNDLVAVGPRHFYASNDHGNRSALGKGLEDYLQLPRSYVVYYDGSDMRIVARGFQYANGINVSHDGSRLYLSTTIGKSLLVYTRDMVSGDISQAQKIKLNSCADNIELDGAGNLYIACHPQLLSFMAHAANAAKFSPSQVLKLSFPADGESMIEEIYLDDGSTISGSSVAAPYQDRLLIGQVFEGFILVGQRP